MTAVCCACSDKITSALTQLAGEGRSKEVFMAAVREAVVGMTKLCGLTAPPSAYITLQQARPEFCSDNDDDKAGNVKADLVTVLL